jgi:hypothetical protein
MGGRRAGTPNKRSEPFLQGLLDAGCVPPQEIAAIVQDKTTDAATKLRYWAVLLPYCYPRCKPIDPEGYVTVEQVASMLGAQMSRVKQAIQQYVTDNTQMAALLAALYPSGHNGQHGETGG